MSGSSSFLLDNMVEILCNHWQIKSICDGFRTFRGNCIDCLTSCKLVGKNLNFTLNHVRVYKIEPWREWLYF